MFMLQQEEDMNLYSFNKVSWCTGYDNKGQHFENREVRLRVMAIRPNILLVSWYEGVYHKVSVEAK